MELRFGRRVVLAIRVALMTALLSAATPARAEADLWCWLFNSGCGGSSSTSSARDVPNREAPEIDPNALAGAFALAAAGAAGGRRAWRRRR